MSRPHDILFAADRGYLPHMATAIASLLANNPHEAFHLHVIHTDIDDQSLAKLRTKIDQPLTAHRIPEDAFTDLPTFGHIARSSYYRLFAADVLPGRRALYLDSDLIVLAPLAPLLATDMAGHAVAAVINPGITPHPGLAMSEGAAYLNSGVMLLDLDQWRARALRESVTARIRQAPQAIRFADQCGLNAVLDGDWLQLHPRYNAIANFWVEGMDAAISAYGDQAVTETRANPAIVHFTGSSKPWQLNDTHPMKASYWHYRRQTAFARRLPDDISLKTIVRRITPAPLQRAARNLLKR